MSGHATIETAVEATRIGALDFLEKPIALQRLLATVKRALRHPEAAVAPRLALAALGRSPALADAEAPGTVALQLRSARGSVAHPEMFALCSSRGGRAVLPAPNSSGERHRAL